MPAFAPKQPAGAHPAAFGTASVGLRLGRYELRGKLSEGNAGRVYAGVAHGDDGFALPVAIKLVRRTVDEDERPPFADEARLAASVSSRHVVKTLDLGYSEEHGPYIVMELVLGLSVSDLLDHLRGAGKHVPPRIALAVLRDLADGLHAVHETRGRDGKPLGLVHRDVSPPNILVGEDGFVRLTDFGVAYSVERSTHTEPGVVKGRLSYLAPEQVQASVSPGASTRVDRRVDVFQLGLVAFEMLTGEAVPRSRGAIPLRSLDENARLPSLRSLRPELPPALDIFLQRATATDPERRYPTARAVSEAVVECAGGSDLLATPHEVADLVERVAADRLARLREWVRSPADSLPPPPMLLPPSTPVVPSARRSVSAAPTTRIGRGGASATARWVSASAGFGVALGATLLLGSHWLGPSQPDTEPAEEPPVADARQAHASEDEPADSPASPSPPSALPEPAKTSPTSTEETAAAAAQVERRPLRRVHRRYRARPTRETEARVPEASPPEPPPDTHPAEPSVSTEASPSAPVRAPEPRRNRGPEGLVLGLDEFDEDVGY